MVKIRNILKVANIIEDGRIAGPQMRMTMIASSLKTKINTKILMPKKDSKEFQKICKKLKVSYFLLPLTNLNKNWIALINYILLFPYEVVSLSRFFKKKQFDIIHLSGGSWQYKGLIAAKIANIKVIWHINDTHITLPLKLIFNLLSHLANAFIFSADRAKQYYFNNVDLKKLNFIISPPVDIKKFDPSKKYKKDKELIKSWKKSIVIGTVCNLNKNKSLETIIEAFSLINKKYTDIRLVIVGPIYKNQKSYYKNLIKLTDKLNIKNIEFIGKREDTRSLLQRFDIFVMTSKYETGPMTLFEAMSMRKAIISTDVADLKKFISNGLNGFLIKVNDSKNLAKKINLLIKNTKLRKKIGTNAQKTVRNNFNLNLSAKLHYKAYKLVYFGKK